MLRIRRCLCIIFFFGGGGGGTKILSTEITLDALVMRLMLQRHCGAFSSDTTKLLHTHNGNRKGLYTFVTCPVSMHGCCHVCPWLIELSVVVLSCVTLSFWTSFTDVSLIKPKDSFIPLFRAVLYAALWVSPILVCFVVVVILTLPSTTSLDTIIIVSCSSVGCLHVFCGSCCCCCVVVLNNLVLLWSVLNSKWDGAL